jgi:hypothetical protein
MGRAVDPLVENTVAKYPSFLIFQKKPLGLAKGPLCRPFTDIHRDPPVVITFTDPGALQESLWPGTVVRRVYTLLQHKMQRHQGFYGCFTKGFGSAGDVKKD